MRLIVYGGLGSIRVGSVSALLLNTCDNLSLVEMFKMCDELTTGRHETTPKLVSTVIKMNNIREKLYTNLMIATTRIQLDVSPNRVQTSAIQA